MLVQPIHIEGKKLILILMNEEEYSRSLGDAKPAGGGKLSPARRKRLIDEVRKLAGDGPDRVSLRELRSMSDEDLRDAALCYRREAEGKVARPLSELFKKLEQA